MKVAIDTNIWISFLIGGYLSTFKEFIVEKKIHICTSEEQIKEIIDVLKRPKFSKYFTIKDINDFLLYFYYTCDALKITSEANECRDCKDNFLLEIALSGKVDYLITNDKDLLELNPYKGIRIIKVKLFEDELKKLAD